MLPALNGRHRIGELILDAQGPSKRIREDAHRPEEAQHRQTELRDIPNDHVFEARFFEEDFPPSDGVQVACHQALGNYVVVVHLLRGGFVGLAHVEIVEGEVGAGFHDAFHFSESFEKIPTVDHARGGIDAIECVLGVFAEVLVRHEADVDLVVEAGARDALACVGEVVWQDVDRFDAETPVRGETHGDAAGTAASVEDEGGGGEV